MMFQLYKDSKVADFCVEDTAFLGVRKIAEKVAGDIRLVTGVKPTIHTYGKGASNLVIIGTLGKSAILDTLEQEGKIDASKVRGKREVYGFWVIDHPMPMVERALVIAGSDKRGTIYGLFHISERIGVSPFVDWCQVLPKKQNELIFTEADNMVSKEPSVRFRGFFINDEWPAFGNWCTKNFGGFNAKAYEHVFELLLRLKGNYLWPAMWSARFEDDGPGLLNAALADEYGVVMGMSHHEPCLRQGEEYRYVRGADSIYGDAWNFRTNEEGITRFWRDGLLRSGKFENVITVGMRGEADTAILGKEATLADNIELLRQVLKTQKQLIQETVNEDLEQVPRMIALYKEVEEFFYGNQEVKGLKGCEELEDVILMLCDDNFGNLRTLPTKEMRSHKGGYGMYYHFDYHGWPISYEWINSSYLPKVWEQMCTAYDFGIRELWIVNVGDICTQEFPLSFFLDLAYDFDIWGTKAINQTKTYTRQWVRHQFQSIFTEQEQEKVASILTGYTKIAHRRRPEAMHAEIYHPVNDREAQITLDEIEGLINMANELYETVLEKDLPAFVSLVYYPAVATLNLYRMQLYTGLNHYFAKLGAMIANTYADQARACFQRDQELIMQYHTIADGKFYGMGMSEHIGFTHWNEDECQNPLLYAVLPAKKPRIMVMVEGTSQHAEGSGWLPNKLFMKDFMEPDITQARILLYNISDQAAEFSVENQVEWLSCDCQGGVLFEGLKSVASILITIDREKRKSGETGEIHVKTPSGECVIVVPANDETKEAWEPYTFFMDKGYLSIEAKHCLESKAGRDGASFYCLDDYGKTKSGMKVYPTTAYFKEIFDAPCLVYQFVTQEAGNYEVELFMQPSNPVTIDNELLYAIACNEETPKYCNAVDAGYRVGDQAYLWADGVLQNIRRKTSRIACRQGVNRLFIYAQTPGFVLEKIVIYKEGERPEERFLGPAETYYAGRRKNVSDEEA